MSEFAARLYAKNKTDLSVRVQGQRLDNKFKVRSGVNTLLLQSARISSLPNTITIRVNGTGCALVQVSCNCVKLSSTFLLMVVLVSEINPSVYGDQSQINHASTEILVSSLATELFQPVLHD